MVPDCIVHDNSQLHLETKDGYLVVGYYVVARVGCDLNMAQVMVLYCNH